MEIWHMKYFMQVCNDKSFSKAAKNLYISQQGLSKTIKNLEKELGISLFDRSVKGVKPTEYGEMLLEKTQKIVNDYDQMIDYFNTITKSNKGTLIIGTSNILHSDFFDTICDFQERYPEIKLDLIELGSLACTKFLDDNLIDICFSVKPDNTDGFDFIPVSVYEMMVMVNKQNSLCNKNKVQFHDLKDEKFIMLSPDYKIRKLTIERCEQSGFYPNIAFTTSQLDFIINLVDLNLGIAVLPVLNSFKATKLSNNIEVILFDTAPFNIEVGYIVKKYGKMNSIANTLVNYFEMKRKSETYK